MTAAIRLDNVSVTRNGNRILEGITATIPRHGVTAVIGPNGAGKTTLLKAMLRLIPYEGNIAIQGKVRRPKIGYVPQRLDFDRGTPITVADFLAMGTQRIPLWFGITKKAKRLAEEKLDRVRGIHLLNRPLGKLSGGELQRAQLAMALQLDPEILFLDEPVAGVDIAGERLFCDLLEEVQQQSHLTMVMVSHDLSVVSQHATHVLCINRRLECEGTAPAVLNAKNLAAMYGPHAGLYDHQGAVSHGHPHHAHDHSHHHHPHPPKGTA
ncbi:MAG: metal ABC transporter ATP-binding protein [Planctomycetota bacterium]